MADNGSDQLNFDPLPPVVEKWRSFERKAIEIRKFAGIGLSDRLDPFSLARLLNLRVVFPKDLPGLSDETRQVLAASDKWSGGATHLLPDGSRIVVINDRHSPRRINATLMEEICHSILGHTPSTISQPQGRSYDRNTEEEAYAVGAAALVPYQILAQKLHSGFSVKAIADHFAVSTQLVEYRMKVLGLWSLYI